MTDLLAKSPSLDSNWRAVVLFGRNVASYKFALAKTLHDGADRADDRVRLEELAGPLRPASCLPPLTSTTSFLDPERGGVCLTPTARRILYWPASNAIEAKAVSSALRASFLGSRQQIVRDNLIHQWAPAEVASDD